MRLLAILAVIPSCGNGALIAHPAYFPYLLRKSSGRGGGDIDLENQQYAGRWAGDEICLVGDYDERNLYETAQSDYHNIAKGLAKEYNEFIKLDDCKVTLG